uniref:Uncharacterized protein n=1 Tax=Rhizophora mucronata TaxID=61149 RepID=A0A2P2QQP7_RHIMU
MKVKFFSDVYTICRLAKCIMVFVWNFLHHGIDFPWFGDHSMVAFLMQKNGMLFVGLVLGNFCISRLVEFRCSDFHQASFGFGTLFIYLLFA